MKNKLAVIMVVLTLLVSGCTKNTKNPSTTLKTDSKEEKITISVATLKGPTGMGMIKLIDDSKKGTTKNNYNFTIAGAPDELTGKIINGEVEIAALPINLAANLYNKTNGKVQLAALNTLGVLYILEKGDSIKSIKDLEGKTIYASGQAATPEYILDYLLKENDVNAKVEFRTEHSELATLALSGNADIVMLPEPFVTTVLSKNAGFRTALDLTDEFEKVNEGTILSMGCLVVNKEFAKNNKEAFNAFLDEYKESAKFVNDNKAEAAELIEKYEIIANKTLAEAAIPNCNIVFIEGNEMKEKIKGLYDMLLDYNKNSIGGSIPGDDFYYGR